MMLTIPILNSFLYIKERGYKFLKIIIDYVPSPFM